jgi:D-amino-acid dehydrogenase
MSSKHVVVVGAGIVGACTASYLQREGHRVTLIESGNPGEGATLGNAGCLNGSSVVPVAMPGTLQQVPRWLFDPLGPLSIRWSYLPKLVPWLWRFVQASTPERVAAQARALRPLTGPTVAMHRELARDAGVEDLIQQVGHLHVYKSDAAHAKDDAGMALRRAAGVTITELDTDELRQLEPELSRDFLRARLIQENGHTRDPRRLATALVAEVQRRGGTLMRARVHSFDIVDRRVVAARTDAGTIAGDDFVIACGAWSRSLAAALGDDVPLDTERGYHVVVRQPEAGPRTPTMSGEGKFVCTPMEMGLRIAGTVEFGGLDLPPNWGRADILLTQLKSMYPRLPQDIAPERITRWMGFRPSMPDSLPVLGAASRIGNAFYAFGHGHIGVISAPMSGRVIADLISRKQASIDIAPFAPTRF